MNYRLLIIIGIILFLVLSIRQIKKINFNKNIRVGQVIDSINGVNIHFNGGVSNTNGRNLADDNYNFGIKYQCVEFIKRYYYIKLDHIMPDTYGNAIDFFDTTLKHGELNSKRNLVQYKNGGNIKPMVDDILIFDKTILNPYGHVAIVSIVNNDSIQIVQQNPGPFGQSREQFELIKTQKNYLIHNKRILGWLRKE